MFSREEQEGILLEVKITEISEEAIKSKLKMLKTWKGSWYGWFSPKVFN